jgi:hypothetical protein
MSGRLQDLDRRDESKTCCDPIDGQKKLANSRMMNENDELMKEDS